MFNGLNMSLGSLSRLSNAVTRSISAENPTGASGMAGRATDGTGSHASRELGPGWKVSPCIDLQPRQVVTIADIDGSGAIQHIWITVAPEAWRKLIIRFYWDNEDEPSIEVPLGDFFCNGWSTRCNIASLAVAVNPAGGFNSYWEMPFRSHARIRIENLSDELIQGFFYQVTYTLTEVPADVAYLHARWTRSNPLPYQTVHTLVDNIAGQGQYVGTYIAWGVNNNGWWGEGEIKFFIDDDETYPTICGTGTEDYFGGAWNFEFPKGQYGVFSSPYSGMPQVITPDGLYRSQQRFGLYRWHITDPIRFKTRLRVTIQALGWRQGHRYLPLQDDIASTAFWYQTEPHTSFPALPDANFLEIN